MGLRFRRELLGRDVLDRAGEPLGRVVETWPLDGGGEPEMVLLRLERHARRRWLPVGDLRHLNGSVFARWTRVEVEDSPDAEDLRWGRPADVARAHWAYVSD